MSSRTDRPLCQNAKKSMKTLVKLSRYAFAGALLGTAVTASSMTIGQIRGSVILGQPLSVSVVMSVNPGEDARSLCLAADVFNGDATVDPNRVTVSMEAADASGNAIARIRSAAIIDEPFVTVSLRAGCSQVSSRRFVLLTDVITDIAPEPAQVAPGALVVPAPSAVTAPAAAAPSVAPPPPAAVPSAATPPAPSPAAALAPPTAQRSTAPAVRRAPGAVAAARPAKVQPAMPVRSEAQGTVKPAPKKVTRVVQPKLKLDPIEAAGQPVAGLRSSTELSSTPVTSPGKAAETAAVWRSLNAQPEDAVKEAQRVQGLEAENKALRDLTSQNNALMAELNARLQKAEDERRLGTYFYLVLALLVLTLVLVAVLWLRLRRRVNAAGAWWEDREEVAKADMRLRMVSGTGLDPSAARTAAAKVDLDLGRTPVAAKPGVSLDSQTTVKMRATAEGLDATALASLAKSANPEELFDIRQQADFFLSLGQTDQAIMLLSNHIRSNEDTGPQAYLDLLRIYHMTGKNHEYESLRASVVRVFNADVPEFSSYGQETRSLESYEELMASVQAAWGTPQAARMLEELIYRRPGSKWSQAFGLTAYQELLSMHALAKEVAAMPAGVRKPLSGFGGLPTAARSDPAAKGATSTVAAGLDLDLGLGGVEPAVGNISAYFERPAPGSSMAATMPAPLEDRPGFKPAPVAPDPAPLPPGNLLDFEVDTPPPALDKPKS